MGIKLVLLVPIGYGIIGIQFRYHLAHLNQIKYEQ